jgi:Ca2+/Na+ antiporter
LYKNRVFIVSLTFLFILTTVSLAALNELRIEVYFSLFAVCYVATSILFKPRRQVFDFVGGGLFLVFCLMLMEKVLESLP